MCDAHSSGKALLSWRLADGDFSQKTIICVQHCKIKRRFTFHLNVYIDVWPTFIMFSNIIKANRNLQKCSSFEGAFSLRFILAYSSLYGINCKNKENNNTHSIAPRCHVTHSGSMSSLTKRVISSSVNVLGSVFFMPSFYGNKNIKYITLQKELQCLNARANLR